MDAYRLKLLLPLTEAQEALLQLKQGGEDGASLDQVSTREMVPLQA